MLITLHYKGGSTTTRNQSVTISVKRTTGFHGFVFTDREGHQAIERGDTEHICFLSTATDDAVLQTVLNQQITQTQRV